MIHQGEGGGGIQVKRSENRCGISAFGVGKGLCSLSKWYTAILRKVFRKKALILITFKKVHAARLKGGLGIHWNFSYWPGGNVQV